MVLSDKILKDYVTDFYYQTLVSIGDTFAMSRYVHQIFNRFEVSITSGVVGSDSPLSR